MRVPPEKGMLCSKEDVEKFTTMATDTSSYSKSTCCTTILDNEGEEALVNHVFSRMSLHAEKAKNLCGRRKAMTLAQVASVKKRFATFTAKFDRMSSVAKCEAAKKMVELDKRVENSVCACGGVVDDVPLRSDFGVMYASGIPVEPGDDLKMSQNYRMIYMGVTTMNRMLREHYHGVTRPMLYYGTTHTFAPIHIEDMSLFSINFLHHGQPKMWITVEPQYVTELRNCIMAETTNSYHSSCPNGPLGHKYYIPSPEWLVKRKIPYKVIIQRQKQAVILYPNTAHLVVNLGMNCAEASNFPSMNWLPYGIASLKCHCLGQEVHMDLTTMVSALKPHWLGCRRDGGVPQYVPLDENPDFYGRIITPSTRPKNAQVDDRRQHEGSSPDEGEETSDDDEAPDVTTKRSRLEYKCTKPSCSKLYQGRQKKNLKQHMKMHEGDKDYQKYMDDYKAKYEKPSVRPKKPCPLCGKLIAASPSNVAIHQKGSNCQKK